MTQNCIIYHWPILNDSCATNPLMYPLIPHKAVCSRSTAEETGCHSNASLIEGLLHQKEHFESSISVSQIQKGNKTSWTFRKHCARQQIKQDLSLPRFTTLLILLKIFRLAEPTD